MLALETLFVSLHVHLYSASQAYDRHSVMKMYQKQRVCRGEESKIQRAGAGLLP